MKNLIADLKVIVLMFVIISVVTLHKIVSTFNEKKT